MVGLLAIVLPNRQKRHVVVWAIARQRRKAGKENTVVGIARERCRTGVISVVVISGVSP